MDWEPPVPPEWHDSHRAFLQALMARGSITLRDAKPILAAIYSNLRGDDEPEIDPESIRIEDVESYASLAREAVSPLDLDIRRLKHQVTNEMVWAIVNINSDPPTQLATAHTPDEIAFIKRLLDAMLDMYNSPRMEAMCVTDEQALKLSRPARNRESVGDDNGEGAASQHTEKALKHSEVIVLMASLVDEGWLERSRRGYYSLTPRALMELWAWMVESYNDPDADGDEWQRIKFCEACKDIVTVGQRCANRECIVRIHDMCLQAFWSSRRNNKRCPTCNTPWDGKHFVGERAATETSANQRGRASGGGGRRSSNMQRVGQEEVDADAVDDVKEE